MKLSLKVTLKAQTQINCEDCPQWSHIIGDQYKKLEFLNLRKWGLLKAPKFLGFCPNSSIKGP